MATGATDYKWTTSDHVINNNNTDSITVTATPEAKQYTCTATDDDGNTGRATTTVASNGIIIGVNGSSLSDQYVIKN